MNLLKALLNRSYRQEYINDYSKLVTNRVNEVEEEYAYIYEVVERKASESILYNTIMEKAS